MARAQDVTKSPNQTAIFITMNFKSGGIGQVRDTIADFCGRIPPLTNSMRNRFPNKDFSIVVGFGARAWKELFPAAPCPKELEVFREIKGAKHTAVSTPADLFFHIRAKTADICFEVSSMIHTLLKDIVIPVDEVHGFRYFDNRAIIGFVDGTENPAADEAADFALIGGEDPYFEGGSYAFIQKYLHNMDVWNAMSTEEQEKTIGRRKFNDLELTDEEKHKNAHNVITKVEQGGEELKIVRANVSFANASKGEFGTFFIGYSGKFSTTRTMLEQMFIGTPQGNSDKILDFSTPKTGALFFIPSYEVLDRIANNEWE